MNVVYFAVNSKIACGNLTKETNFATQLSTFRQNTLHITFSKFNQKYTKILNKFTEKINTKMNYL